MSPATINFCPGEFNSVWAAVAGHHGQPRNNDGDSTELIPGLTPKYVTAARAFSQDVRALFEPLDDLPRPDERNLNVLSWLVCGLTVVSDWIWSNRDWFAYRDPSQTLAEYWDYARGQAAEAIIKAGVLPSKLSVDMSPTRLLSDKISASLNPLQQRVCDMPLPEGPSLTIIEDVIPPSKYTGPSSSVIPDCAAAFFMERRGSGILFAAPAPVRTTRSRVCGASKKNRCTALGMTSSYF